MLRTPVPLLPRHLDIAGDAGDVERRVDGMKLPTETGRETRGGAGAAVGIGIEEGT